MAKGRQPLEYITMPGVDCIATLEFANGLVVRGDVHSAKLELAMDEWPLITLEMHALEIKVDGDEAKVEDLIRMIRFKKREGEK